MHGGVGAPGAPRLRARFRLPHRLHPQRAQDAQVPGREGVGRTQGAHGHDARRPGSHARQGQHAVAHRIRIGSALESQLARSEDGGQRQERPGPGPRHADPRDAVLARLRHGLGRRWEPVQPGERGLDGLTQRRGDPPRHRGRGANADLLADHHPHRRLEGVERTVHAKSGAAPHRGGQQGVAPQRRGHRGGVHVEVEERTEPDRERASPGREGRRHLHPQRRPGRFVRDRHPAATAPEANRAAVGAALHLLHPGGAARREGLQHRLPVERRPVGEVEDHPALGAPPSIRAAASGCSAFRSSSWMRQSVSRRSFEGSMVPVYTWVKVTAHPEGWPGFPVTS